MSGQFYIKQGDTSPSIQRSFDLAEGQTLAGAVVRFKMMNSLTLAVVVDDICSPDPANSTATYNWQAADTAEHGYFQAEWEITFAGGQIETYPNYEFDEIVISPEIRAAP